MMIGADGENRRPFLEPISDPNPQLSLFHPSFSPDGTKLVVLRGGLSVPEPGLVVVTIDGGSLTPIPGTQGASQPSFSPDGTSVVYEKEHQIHVINVDGSEHHQLTTSPSQHRQRAADLLPRRQSNHVRPRAVAPGPTHV